MREDVLARDLTDVRYRQHGCKVESGTLADPYTGKTIHFVRGARTSSAVQIDHVVALENAWQSGANQWDRTKRYRFGNDHVQPAGGGRAGQSGEGLRVGRVLAADERRIPLRLRGRQIGVKAKYGLTVTTKEKRAMLSVLRACPAQAVPEK